jgi:2-methylcitrate dehydratase
MEIRIPWETEGYDGVVESTIKKYNAAIHSQSTIFCTLELARQHRIDPGKVISIEADVTQITYDFTGGGQYGLDKVVQTKTVTDRVTLSAPAEAAKKLESA